MSELKDRVSKEIITAMKAKDKIRLNVLRYLKKLFIENDTAKKPVPEMDIVISHAKKIKDSISLYPAGSPQALELQEEVIVMEEFLPKQLSEEEVIAMINEIKASQEKPNMGSVMKELSARTKGQFDGKKATELVKANL
ncbi:GatB/YqeY domain-containing protein [Bacteriovorax sp. Seq25_V]|uniref:GatB/YqeY domain-containing protein n=1 Tax=Bacteriovorax sp. Seq25_V TaxID=1201288 RepID=UPI000389DB1D|nr:GatB/YqeY domain-containing protein [Bacteriovorax sp. Seq25_V]EQC43908.1 YqeY-like protein [Bacteriovorax sp. Seq25_V]